MMLMKRRNRESSGETPAGLLSKSSSMPIYVLFMMFLVEVASTVSRSMFSVLQVPMQRDFALSDTQLGFMIGAAAYIPGVLVCLPIARVAERFSLPVVMAAGIFVRSVATASCAIVGNVGQLFVARAFMGAGDGSSQPIMVSVVANHFRPNKRGMALSIVITGLSIGNLVGPVAAAWLSGAMGWRNAMLAFAVPGIVLAVVVALSIRDGEYSEKKTVSSARTKQEPSKLLRDLGLLVRNRPYLLYWVGTSLLAMEMAGTAAFTAIFFVRKFEVSLINAAWLTGLGAGVTGLIGSLLGGFIANRFADTTGRAYVYITAASCGFAGLFYTLAFTRSEFFTAAALMVVANFAGSLKNGTVHAAAQNMSPSHMRATTAAVSNIGVMLVGGAGPLVVGLISDSTAAATFSDAMGSFRSVCQAHGALEMSAAVASACKQASSDGMRMGLLVLCGFYALSTAFLIASGRAIKDSAPLEADVIVA